MAKKPPRFVKKRNTYYHVGYMQSYDENGKKLIKRPYTSLGNDYYKALIKWAEVEADQTAVKDTFGALCKKYKEDVFPEKSENTQLNQGYQIKKLQAVFGEMLLSDIKPHHIGEYLDTRDKKIAANREIQLMSAMFTKAIRWGWCDFNPTKGVERNDEETRKRYITDDEFLLMRSKAGEELRAMIDLGYATSLRISDIRNIRKRKPSVEMIKAKKEKLDVAFTYIEDGILHAEHIKTGHKQEFLIQGLLEDAIERAKKVKRKISSEYLFSTRKGQPHTKSGFDSKWQRFREKIGLFDVNFHDIRGKAATDAKRRGLNYQALLGHTDISQSEKYANQRLVERVLPIDFVELGSRSVEQAKKEGNEK